MVDLNQVAKANEITPTFKSKAPKQKPTKRVKALKQLILDEQKYIKQHEPTFNRTNYFSIESGPSIKPIKKYCDITGLKGNYKSPSSGIIYHNSEIYSIVKNMSTGVDQQYLELRNANVILK